MGTAFDRPPAPVAGLTFVDRIGVPFRGDRDGTGPLTVGQRAILEWTMTLPDGVHLDAMPLVVELPGGAAVDDVAAALAVLLARYEALRTTYLLGEEPVQRVARTGELPIDVYQATPDSAEPGEAAVARLVDQRRTRRFDLAGELPLRVAVVTGHGLVRQVVLVLSHMAVDYYAVALIRRQLVELVGDPAARQPGPPVQQPLDLAAAQRSPAGQRRIQAALQYWERQRRRMPQVLYAMPISGAGERASLRVILRSRAAALALQRVTARLSATRHTVLVAAVAALLSRRTGHRHCPIFVVSDNRVGRDMHGFVGTAATDALLVIDADATSFDALIRRAGTAMLAARRHSMVDTVAQSRDNTMIEHERGVEFPRDCAINDISGHVGDSFHGIDPEPPAGVPELAQIIAALPETAVVCNDPGGHPELLMFRVLTVERVLRLALLTGDVRRVPRAEGESLLRGVERLLVAAAEADVDLRQLGDITGVEPVVRGPDWVYVDSCWVEISAVQRLVDEVVRAPLARVFTIPDATGRPVIVAFLVAGDPARTPEQVHTACVAALPGRYTAMAPGRYVICDRAPEQPSSLVAWQALRPVAEGDGRSLQKAVVAP